MAITNRLKEIRAAKGLTQDQLAEALGVSQAHVSRLESGYAPSFELSQGVCRVLGAAFHDIWPTGGEPAETISDVADRVSTALSDLTDAFGARARKAS